MHIELNPKTVRQGTNFTILCRAYGQPPFDMTLDFIPEYTGMNWTNIPMLHQFNGGQNRGTIYGWKIKNAQRNHAGRYKCVAQTSDGVISSQNAHLKIICTFYQMYDVSHYEKCVHNLWIRSLRRERLIELLGKILPNA